MAGLRRGSLASDNSDSSTEDTIVVDTTTRTRIEAFSTEEHAPRAQLTQFEYKSDDPRWKKVAQKMELGENGELRPGQARVLHVLSKDVSVLLLARTSWGKSLIFQGRYHMLDDLETPTETRTHRYITVIFVPLSGLGAEQTDKINKRARRQDPSLKEDPAIFYDSSKFEEEYLMDIQAGRYKWVFISPEKSLHPDVMRKLWENSDFRQKVLLLAVDEAHLVSDWYAITLHFCGSLKLTQAIGGKNSGRPMHN